jgi:hypothetical protein
MGKASIQSGSMINGASVIWMDGAAENVEIVDYHD